MNNEITNTKLSTDITVKSSEFDVISFHSLFSHAFLDPSPLFYVSNASLVSRMMSWHAFHHPGWFYLPLVRSRVSVSPDFFAPHDRTFYFQLWSLLYPRIPTCSLSGAAQLLIGPIALCRRILRAFLLAFVSVASFPRCTVVQNRIYMVAYIFLDGYFAVIVSCFYSLVMFGGWVLTWKRLCILLFCKPSWV